MSDNRIEARLLSFKLRLSSAIEQAMQEIADDGGSVDSFLMVIGTEMLILAALIAIEHGCEQKFLEQAQHSLALALTGERVQ